MSIQRLYTPEEHIRNGWFEPHETPEYEAYVSWLDSDKSNLADEVIEFFDDGCCWQFFRLVEVFYRERRNCLRLAGFNEQCDGLKLHQLMAAYADDDISAKPLVAWALESEWPDDLTPDQKAAFRCVCDMLYDNAEAIYERYVLKGVSNDC